MRIKLTPFFEECFLEYKKVYQEFTGYTDEKMPKDEELIMIAMKRHGNILKDLKKGDKDAE